MKKEQLLEKITKQYLESRDFNGLPLSIIKSEKETIMALVREGNIEIARAEFDLLMNTPVVAEVVQMTFCCILEFMLRAVLYVARINKRAIEELTRT
jgi:hypothetical protein